MGETTSMAVIKKLPKIEQLKRLCQSIAVLDAIIEPEWEFRYYSYNSKWGQDEEMASMRDGSGDSYFILFNPQGAIIKGYSHESSLGEYAARVGHPYPGILEQVPDIFQNFLKEPAFSIENSSFCIWRQFSDEFWNKGDIGLLEGDDPDGSNDLLFILDGNPTTYQQWAESYYDKPINLDAVESIYRHAPITEDLLALLNPTLSMLSIEEELLEIGYRSIA